MKDFPLFVLHIICFQWLNYEILLSFLGSLLKHGQHLSKVSREEGCINVSQYIQKKIVWEQAVFLYSSLFPGFIWLVAFCKKRRPLPKSRPQMTRVKLRPEVASEGTRCHSLSISMLCRWLNPPTNQQICSCTEGSRGYESLIQTTIIPVFLHQDLKGLKEVMPTFFFFLINYQHTFLSIPNHGFRRLTVVL